MKTISFRLSILATIPGYTTRGQTLRSPNTWLQHGDKRNRKNYKSKSNSITLFVTRTHSKQIFGSNNRTIALCHDYREYSATETSVQYNKHHIDCTRFLCTPTAIFSVSSSVFYSSPNVSLWVCSLTQGHQMTCLPLHPALRIA